MSTASLDLRTVPIVEKADAVNGRIDHFLSHGFKEEEIGHIRTAVRTTLIRPEDLDQKIKDLKERGFTDPVKMITSLPAILGYAIDNIDGKIKDLKERGFTDPVKMITSLPAILGYAIDNIDGKIKLIERVSEHFGADINPAEIIECELGILGTKIDKLWVLTRVLVEQNRIPTRQEVHALLFAKIEDVVLAHSEPTSGSFANLLQRLKMRKKEGSTREELRGKIAATLKDDPGNKVVQRYARGYPFA